MARSFYIPNNQIKTKLSGGRPHYTFREKELVTKFSSRALEFGENPYTIALGLFGDDKKYYIITDINTPKDAMTWEANDVINEPEDMVENSYDKPRIY